MQTFWFVVVALAIVAYVVLDGFDLGVGAVYKWVARTPEDRAVARAAIGPVWDANEVWLLAGGGTLYFAFPALYAASFSGFYLPLMIVLWLLIGRALGLELRAHLPDPLLAEACDAVFAISSLLLTIFFGAALGNVVRGVPIEADGYFFLPLWTDFRVGAHPGVLDWYTVLSGVVAAVALAAHGACWLVLRVDAASPVHARAAAVARAGRRALMVLTPLSLVATLAVRPGVLDNFRAQPIGFALPLAVAASLIAGELAGRRGRERGAFAASCVYLTSMLGGAAFALYPVLLPSSDDPSRALTIEKAATSPYAMSIAAGWWIFAFVLVAGAFMYLYRSFRGKISSDAGGYGH
ncbi:MAG TPA: cytochrome d ubiquinol oxidase subunit II [Polyangia bacterium]|nr:cytochrome d ubiquinol oxidase subunit II [Polyangia bacterium]HVZ73863.1 cytochrome d ubiquinol oxidase subunit II [Polyangia bacterium]